MFQLFTVAHLLCVLEIAIKTDVAASYCAAPSVTPTTSPSSVDFPCISIIRTTVCMCAAVT